MYWNGVTTTIYNDTSQNVEEITEETFAPIDYKICMIVGPNSEDRGRREKMDNALLIYMFNISDYKGDIFDAVSFNLPGALADHPECDELYDYLINTGKII